MEVMTTNALAFRNWKVPLASIWDQRLLQSCRSIQWLSMLRQCVTWETGTKIWRNILPLHMGCLTLHTQAVLYSP